MQIKKKSTNRFHITTILLLLSLLAEAQLVEVQVDYNSNRDCIFGAYNNAAVPMFVHINFADLQFTAFSETLPYIKKLDPGFNSLFTLYSENGQTPRFQYDIKSYHSDPTADVNLNFPYLITFEPGLKVSTKNIKSIAGFRGEDEPKSWVATGFNAKTGNKVYAARQGIIVEIAGKEKAGEPIFWYNAWNYSVTLLQTDGTLICYRNVFDKENKLELNQKIHAGELLGEIAPGANELILLIYHNMLSGSVSINHTGKNSTDLHYIIPQFVVNDTDIEILNSAKEYIVIHPNLIRGLEMSKREKKKILQSK